MYAIYKPSKKNTGFAASFTYSIKDDNVYATILKQCGFDEKNQNGAFKASKEDPEAHVNIKLSISEVGGILDCIDRGREFSKYHDSDFGKPKRISFIKWMSKGENNEQVHKGYSFSITVTDKENLEYKNAFYIGFTFEEARVLREALIYSLNQHFAKVSSRQKTV